MGVGILKRSKIITEADVLPTLMYKEIPLK